MGKIRTTNLEDPESAYVKLDQRIIEMPFLNFNTNLSKDKVTAETMNALAHEMSTILGKDTKWINWMLSTDKLMSRTPNNENSPYIWLEIQSIGSFDEKEKCQSLAPKILDAVTKLTDVPKENIHLLLKTLERHQCVMNGVC